MSEINVSELNVRAVEYMEIGRNLSVTSNKERKKAESILNDLKSDLAKIEKASQSNSLTADEKKRVLKVLQRLNIANNFISKPLDAYIKSEEQNKLKKEELERKRVENKAKLAERVDEMRKRRENQNKEDSKKSKK